MADFDFPSWGSPEPEPPSWQADPESQVEAEPQVEPDPVVTEPEPVTPVKKPKRKAKPTRSKTVSAAQVEAVLQADQLADVADEMVAALTGKSDRDAQIVALVSMQAKLQTPLAQVQKIVETNAMLANDQTRQVAELLTGKHETIEVIAALMAGKIGGLQLLIQAHDADSQVDAQKVLLAAHDIKEVREAARVAVLLAPELEGVVNPNGGSQIDVALVLGEHVRDLQVANLRGLLV